MEIRQLTIGDDLENVCNMLTELYSLHNKALGHVLDQIKFARIPVREILQSRLERENNRYFVAANDNDFVGMIRCEIQDTGFLFLEEKQLFLDELFVVPKYRRQGIGTKLISACKDYAKSEGISLITTKVYSFNSEPKDLIEKLGFQCHYSYFMMN